MTGTPENHKSIQLAQQFNMDADDIGKAYKNKPDSLTAHFNAMSEAKQDRGYYAVWGLIWLVVLAPVALYPAWKLGEKYYSLWATKNALKSEVASYKETTKPDSTPPAP